MSTTTISQDRVDRSVGCFGLLQKNFNPQRRIAYHFLFLSIGHSSMEVRFHWSRYGGQGAAIAAAKAFSVVATRALTPLLNEYRGVGSTLHIEGDSNHGLPAGVRLVGLRRGRTVIATARRQTLGRLKVAEVGLNPALKGGCDLRIDLQSEEFSRRREVAQRIAACLQKLVAGTPAALSIHGASAGAGRHHYSVAVTKVPSFCLMARPAGRDGRHAYDVQLGTLFSASFAWAPTRAKRTLAKAKKFLVEGKTLARRYRRFMDGFRAVGHRQVSRDLPNGISRMDRQSGPVYMASWPSIHTGQVSEGAAFSTLRYGSPEAALRAALEAREKGLAKLARWRARVGVRFFEDLTERAAELGGVAKVPSKQELLAALQAA